MRKEHRASLILVGALLLVFTGLSVWAETIEVSQPIQLTSSPYYERGQSIVYDGSEYWLVYGRSSSVTTTYDSGNPDTHDYGIFYRKATTIAGLATASEVVVRDPFDGYLGETGAALVDGEVWIFASKDMNNAQGKDECWIKAFYPDASGTNGWKNMNIWKGLSTGQGHHDEIFYNGELWVLEGSGDFNTKHQSTPKSGGWTNVSTEPVGTGGLAHFFTDGGNLYLAVYSGYSGGANYIYQYNSGSDAWMEIDQVSPPEKYDPTLFKVGGTYVFAQAPWESDGSPGGRQYIISWSNGVLDATFFAGTIRSVSEAEYGSNSWIDMWPIGLTDAAGSSYLFFTSERDGSDPTNQVAGNIWVLPVDWDPANDHFTYIQSAVDASSPGDTVAIGAGTYAERVDGSSGDDLVIAGAGAGSVTWVAPTNDWAFYNSLFGSTETTFYEFTGLTFVGADVTGAGAKGGGILVNRANNGGKLYLLIHGNTFVDNSTAPGGWVSSILLCHNRSVARDGLTGLGPVRIYNNVDETTGGICMSNSLSFDIFSNIFDGCADALFIGYGCPTGTTIGDHYIYFNNFLNQVGTEPSIYMGYWGTGTGMTFLPNMVLFNVFKDSDNAIGYGMDTAIAYPSDLFSFNSFETIAGVGINVAGTDTAPIEGTLNWWGSANGPTTASNPGGDGVAVSDNVIYSPWLGSNPDSDPGTPGVQLGEPLYIIVDDVGPVPADQIYQIPAGLGLPVSGTLVLPAGYLNRAIGAADAIAGHDTIMVLAGAYVGDESITDGVTIEGQGAAEDILIGGPVDIRAGDVLLGGFRTGLTINGSIGVAAGVDASTIHINWSNLYGVVTNAGDNTLDATYNFWGDDGPDTVGAVAIHPILPEMVGTIVGYIDDYGLSVSQAITLGGQVVRGLSPFELVSLLDLMQAFGFSVDEAAEIVLEYGHVLVDRALAICGGDYDEFLVMLIGYGAPAGGGAALLGGGAGGSVGESGLPVFHVGETVPLVLPLVHPITGEPMDEAFVTYTVGRQLEDGSYEIVLVGAMTYDGDLGAFIFDLDTTGVVPGIYDIYLGSDDGRSQHLQIEIAP